MLEKTTGLKIVQIGMGEDALVTYKEIFLQYLNKIRNVVNEKSAGTEPWQLIASTVVATLLLVWLHTFLFQPESLTSRFKKWFIRFIRKLPFIGTEIQKQMNKTMDDMASGLSFLQDKKRYIKTLPAKGLSQPEVLKMMKEYNAMVENQLTNALKDLSRENNPGRRLFTILLEPLALSTLWKQSTAFLVCLFVS